MTGKQREPDNSFCIFALRSITKGPNPALGVASIRLQIAKGLTLNEEVPEHPRGAVLMEQEVAVLSIQEDPGVARTSFLSVRENAKSGVPSSRSRPQADSITSCTWTQFSMTNSCPEST